MNGFHARAVILVAIAALLAGCGHSRVVKREGASSGPQRSVAATPRSGNYVVKTGDTLYGIAFRHGLDYRDVAGWNRIGPPYTIYPGQTLALRGRSSSVAARPASQGQAAGTQSPARPAQRGSTPVTAPVTPSPAVPARTATPAVSGTPVVVPATPVVPAGVSAGGWRWPTQGQLIGRFAAEDPKRQGIGIAGTAGQPVVAAADGVVVYSGAGLVGYGELIIVKHSDEWLSAYAHNRRRLVAEGAAVKAGEQIAELGRSGTSRDMLHFEIRRNGKPVDPLTILPRP
jgi:lipoprotein NlpD